MLVCKETSKQKQERRATRAVNTPQQYSLNEFMYAKYGIYGRR